MVGKINPVLVICDIKADSIDVLSYIPNDINPASVIWNPDGSGVVGVGYIITPRKFGLIYCTNRPSHIFSLTLDGQYSECVFTVNICITILILDSNYNSHVIVLL